MPRKKTVQPKPLQVICTEDLEIEIRDSATQLIGRGLDKKFESDELNNQVLLGLVDDLLSGDRNRIKRAEGALSSNQKMSTYLQLAGYELEPRSCRRHAKAIHDHYEKIKHLISNSPDKK